ncbi:putative zinc-finger domain protein [Acinetobacter phage Loki]|uniref:Putative zinc-finger domain protein n=1 Tax=Acinetobacter phage Loki TaxID=1970374 RepID=A0A0P1KKL7_9CAUD|nr:putative zinc-finger domain protein [Acinetobacter phage Loki]CUS06496.1 putative zinc-finger domain protein [Acinetobacter phage Loki]
MKIKICPNCKSHNMPYRKTCYNCQTDLTRVKHEYSKNF